MKEKASTKVKLANYPNVQNSMSTDFSKSNDIKKIKIMCARYDLSKNKKSLTGDELKTQMLDYWLTFTE